MNATEPPTPRPLPQQGALDLVIARIASGDYAFPGVEEMHRLPHLLPLPGAPPSVLGMFDLRGENLPVISAHLRLGLPPAPLELASPIVVCVSNDRRYAVLVEEVVEFVRAPADTLSPPPTQVPHAPFVWASAQLAPERNVLVFDPHQFFGLHLPLPSPDPEVDGEEGA